MIVPGLQVVTVYALTTLRADYRFPTTTTATATTTTATVTKA
jgi:hypothetical protein